MSLHALLHKTSLLALFFIKTLIQSSKFKEGKENLTPSLFQKNVIGFVEFAFLQVGFFALILENYGKILDLNNNGNIKTFAFKKIEKIISQQHPSLIEQKVAEVALSIDLNDETMNIDNEKQIKNDFPEAKFEAKFSKILQISTDFLSSSALFRKPIDPCFYCNLAN